MTQNPMIRVAVNITTAMYGPLLHWPLLVVVTDIRFLLVVVGSLVLDVVAPIVFAQNISNKHRKLLKIGPNNVK